MGVPVVATDLPGVRVPILRTGMGMVVPPRDSEAIAEAIKDILRDKKDYVKDKRVIIKEFEYEEIFREVLGR